VGSCKSTRLTHPTHLLSGQHTDRRLFAAYTHLITIALWDVLSCLLVKYEQWEPVPLHGASGYMRPLPAFVLAAIALLVGIHL
jgi:hypothetical protein